MLLGSMSRFFRVMGVICVAAAFTAVDGCSNSSAGANMSAEDYKKAAMGSKMSPEQEAAMGAAVKKNIEETKARAAAAPHGPPSSPGASR